MSRRGIGSILQVVLPHGSTFTLPWAFVYDIYLPSDRQIKDVPVCQVVEDWDDRADGRDMVEGTPRRCSYDNGKNHLENLLCPFGFWGLRYSLEQLTSRDMIDLQVGLARGLEVVIAETEIGVSRENLARHVQRLRSDFEVACNGIEVREVRTFDELRQGITRDLPIVYFLCHGEDDRATSSTFLAIGRGEKVTPADVRGWIDVVRRSENRIVWTKPRPLVFINACESVAIRPESLVDYVTTFIGFRGAAGVIGTEVKVHQDLAMAFANHFFKELLKGATVDTALHRARIGFLAKGNLFGLLYTPYCFADLKVVPAS